MIHLMILKMILMKLAVMMVSVVVTVKSHKGMTDGDLSVLGCHSKSDWWSMSKNWSQPAPLGNARQGREERESERVCNQLYFLAQIAGYSEILYQGTARNLLHCMHTGICTHTLTGFEHMCAH